MVLVVVVERERVRRLACGCRLGISTLEQVLVEHVVLHDEAAAEEVVRGVGMLNHEWFLFTMYCSVCSSIAHFNGKNKQKILYNQEKQRKDYMQK